MTVETTTRNDEQPVEGSTRRGRAIAVAIVVFAGIAVLAGLAVLAARILGSDGASWDVVPGQYVEVTIEPGETAREIYDALDAAGVTRRTELAAAASSLAVEGQLRPGTYGFETDSPAEEVIRSLVEGPNLESANRFTVVEGWTVEAIIDALAAHTGRSVDEFRTALSDGSVTSPYLPSDVGIDPVTRWEGLLFPATYDIGPGATAPEALGPMADEFDRRMSTIDWSRLEVLGVSRYEAIVVGSLVQREAGIDDERRTISSVIHNRLAQGMRLQIDATVIYALGYNPGRVLAEHLEVDSPYNTYRVEGLPPTPIGTVGLESLRAAVDPSSTDFLFYVLGTSDGGHLFAETYDGHQQNIEIAREAGILP